MISTLQPARPAPTRAVAQALRRDVERSATRGRRLSMLSLGMLVFAVLIAGFFVIAGLDALIPMPGTLRGLLLLGLLLGAAVVGGWAIIRCVRSPRYTFGTAERIDEVTHHRDQPVVRGLSLMPAGIEDRLADSLRERAERNAADLTSVTPPRRVYPLRLLRRSAALLVVALLAWVVLAIIFPAQFGGMLARVLLPWGGAPPFSLTQLDPAWTPDEPTQGDDVTVSVQPEGVQPETVDFVRLDEQGNEAERFEMTADEQGGFSHTLAGIQSPIRFHLETRGRPTRDYTIDPRPKPQPAPGSAPGSASGSDAESDSDQAPQDPGGTTTYDPQAAAELVRNAHEDWPELRGRIEALMKKLADARQRAEAMDPTDREALKVLEADLGALSDEADDLTGDVRAMHADLPPDAAATLGKLLAALEQMQSDALGACPNPASTGSPAQPTDAPGSDPGTADAAQTPQQWLDQVGQAAGADTRRLASGLGHSSVPTDSGTASGRPNGAAPDFTDPAATGAYDEQGVTAETGPLPPAVMQQVPPSYREHIRAYFTELAESENKP